MEMASDDALAHAHCPSTGLHDSTGQDEKSSEAFSSACERACGLTLNAVTTETLVALVSLSVSIPVKVISKTPHFSKVPYPPPIA